MSSAPSGWQNPKTNWDSKDPVGVSDLNRMEGNPLAIETGDRTLDPAQAPSSNTGTLRQILSWLANRIRAITGMANWYDAPPTTLTAAKSHIDAAAPHSGHETPTGAQAKVDAHANLTAAHSATSTATANRIIIRDSAGRAKVAAPSASDDIATKGYVDQAAADLIIASVSPMENSVELQPNGMASVNGSWVALIPSGATTLEIWFVACKLTNDFRFRIGYTTPGIPPVFHSVYDTDAGGEISTGTPLVSVALPGNALDIEVCIQNVADSARTPSSIYGLSFGFRFT
mgnify:CR=1 FL=1